MKHPLISVIVPVYNARKYIIECLESIRIQTYTNLEVLIVNDGSTDDSRELIREFISAHALENFHIIDKENGGICSARNAGLAAAKGAWIVFIDSDDWIEPRYVESMVEADAKYHADFYIAGFRVYDVNSDSFDIWSSYTVEYGSIPKELKELRSFDYVWARMYKKSIIDEYCLRFDERIRFCEDNAFNFDYVGVISSFACVSEIGYTYRRGHSGAMSKMAVTPHMRKYIGEHMYSFCNKMPEESIIAALRENKSFSRIMWNVQLTDVVIDILENNSARAKEKMKQPLATAIVEAFVPNTKKDKLYRYLWNKSFFIFRFFVKLFYKNVDKIKKVKWLGHFLSH